jgi:hypothetical protein
MHAASGFARRRLRLSWLLELGTKGSKVNKKYSGVLLRRQDMPDEAFSNACGTQTDAAEP